MKTLLKFILAAFLPLFFALQAQAITANITAIYGTGNPNADWDVFTNGNTQIGLRAKNSTTGATPDNGSGLYTFAPGTLWNFEASFNTNYGTAAPGAMLSAYDYSWTVSGPSIAGGSITFDPTLKIDNSYGTNATANGAGIEGTFGDLGGTNTLMQLSQKITFGPWNGNFNTEGLYTISASMSQNGQQVNFGSIQVQVGSANVPDNGKTVAMLAFGLIGLIGVHRLGRSKQLDTSQTA